MGLDRFVHPPEPPPSPVPGATALKGPSLPCHAPRAHGGARQDCRRPRVRAPAGAAGGALRDSVAGAGADPSAHPTAWATTVCKGPPLLCRARRAPSAIRRALRRPRARESARACACCGRPPAGTTAPLPLSSSNRSSPASPPPRSPGRATTAPKELPIRWRALSEPLATSLASPRLPARDSARESPHRSPWLCSVHIPPSPLQCWVLRRQRRPHLAVVLRPVQPGVRLPARDDVSCAMHVSLKTGGVEALAARPDSPPLQPATLQPGKLLSRGVGERAAVPSRHVRICF